jgi:nucleoside-diphosphate-sugar epimerase
MFIDCGVQARPDRSGSQCHGRSSPIRQEGIDNQKSCYHFFDWGSLDLGLHYIGRYDKSVHWYVRLVLLPQSALHPVNVYISNTAWDAYTPPSLEGPFANVIDAYGTSKAAALAATDRFIKHETPSFDVVSILPSMVTGWNEMNLTAKDVAKGSNATPLGVLLTTRTEVPTLGVSVHVEDVARAHVDALKPSIPGNRNYICSSGGLAGTVWDDAKDVARQHFSRAVESGSLPLAGAQPSRPIHLDTSETEEAFGWKFASFDEQIKSVAGHYLELLAAEQA